MKARLQAGELEDKEVEITFPGRSMAPVSILGAGNFEQMEMDIQGIYMINMGLGSPQGNCVGWSAYDGPNNTFNANNPAPNYCTQPTSKYPIN